MSGSVSAKTETGAGLSMWVLVIFPSSLPAWSLLLAALNSPTAWLMTLAGSTTGPIYTDQDPHSPADCRTGS